MRLKAEDISKIAFSIRYGHYKFLEVLFRVINAPTMFMCLMNQYFSPYLDNFKIVYIDDILVYFQSHKENAKYLKVVL